MKIFDLEYWILSSIRKAKARVRKAFQKKELSSFLILRYLSLFIIAFNIFASSGVTIPSKTVSTQKGIVLSQEVKAEPVKTPQPVRVSTAVDFDKFLGKAALVVDATTSAVLFEKNSQQKLPPASLTKIMTSLVALGEHNLTDTVKISKDCTQVDGVKVGFVSGQNFSVSSLLYALLLPSASDAACALSQLSPESSSSAKFVSEMNKKTADLGLLQTHFTNPVGLDDPNHFSTAKDLLTLSQAFLLNKDLSAMAGTYQRKITTVDGQQSFGLKNTNELLALDTGFKGLKTGSLSKDYGCLAFLYEKDGHQILGVILGSPDRFADARNLVAWIFSSYKWE